MLGTGIFGEKPNDSGGSSVKMTALHLRAIRDIADAIFLAFEPNRLMSVSIVFSGTCPRDETTTIWRCVLVPVIVSMDCANSSYLTLLLIALSSRVSRTSLSTIVCCAYGTVTSMMCNSSVAGSMKTTSGLRMPRLGGSRESSTSGFTSDGLMDELSVR